MTWLPWETHPEPYDPCPKCGNAGIMGWAEQWSVRYDADPEIAPEGRLCWDCRTCGYVKVTQTKDGRR